MNVSLQQGTAACRDSGHAIKAADYVGSIEGFNTKQQPRESMRLHQPGSKQQRQHLELTGRLQSTNSHVISSLPHTLGSGHKSCGRAASRCCSTVFNTHLLVCLHRGAGDFLVCGTLLAGLRDSSACQAAGAQWVQLQPRQMHTTDLSGRQSWMPTLWMAQFGTFELHLTASLLLGKASQVSRCVSSTTPLPTCAVTVQQGAASRGNTTE